MALQRFTIKLTQLRCIKESDSGPSEPYLWVTYFALGPQLPPFQPGPLALNTPAYDAFRTEFSNNVSAGSVVGIPAFVASASFDMDLSAPGPKLLGCVAVLMEEDDTRQSDAVLGRIAYSKEMHKQLNALMVKRIQSGDSGPITDAEKAAIKTAVSSKVEDAVGSHQGFFDIFRDQDDPLGFTYKIFPESMGGGLQAATFDFPEITTIKTLNVAFSPVTLVTDRYVLSGEVTIADLPADTVDVCAAPRATLDAKRQQIRSLLNRVVLLQQQLQHAAPQQKAAIVAEIVETNAEIGQHEAQLPALEAALKACTTGLLVHGELHNGAGVHPG